MERLLANYKWLLSFFKSEWTVQDYPLRIKEQATCPANSRWAVQIINWWQLSGVGATKEEALHGLTEMLARVAENKGRLPRPGRGFPIEFASTDELELYWEIASTIAQDVLGFGPERTFISDGTSLWDFEKNGGISEYLSKIEEIFGVDVSHIEDGDLVEICKYISVHTKEGHDS